MVAALCAAAPATAQESNASGTLTLNGVDTPLRYAYASAEPGFFDKTTDDIRVLLSDVPLAEEARKDVFALSRLARRTDAHIVEVTLNATAEPISGAIYAPEFNGMLSLTGMHRFEQTRLDRTGISGQMHTRAAGQIAQVTYAYSATFSATIVRPPTPEEVAASISTPAGVAAARYVAAVTRGPLSVFLTTLSASTTAGYAGSAGAAKLAALRKEMPGDSRVTLVTSTSATTATATVQGHEGALVIEYELLMVLESGAWKVTY